MYCIQCEETTPQTGCRLVGVCGKSEETARLQDLVLFAASGVAWWGQILADRGDPLGPDTAALLRDALFVTVTNVTWDDEALKTRVDDILAERDRLAARVGRPPVEPPAAAVWRGPQADDGARGRVAGRAPGGDPGLETGNDPDPDLVCLRELLTLGVKGIAAYAAHAAALGRTDPVVDAFVVEALAATLTTSDPAAMQALVLRAGAVAVAVMALLDSAHTDTYGHPRATPVALGVGDRPGILVSGHDLRDLDDLLAQTEGTGIDVYTHGEMLPAHAYPAFRRYGHLVGNYGGAWWQQADEFARFNGPILLTTNCLIPPRPDAPYRDRLFTTGVVGCPGAVHVPDRPDGGRKDFSALIARARTCLPPTGLETGHVTIGFAHDQVLTLADAVIEAVSSGAIRRFVVLAGCDGRKRSRAYYTEVAKTLPDDAVILTAGCAKYRYNKLDLGTINGIPRILDAGQCNDSYSLVKVALTLKEVLGVGDINDLPISYDIAWYEQKAVAVLLALLHVGVTGIRLGPTLPAFLSPGVARVLGETFGIRPIGPVAEDVVALMAGA